MAELIGFLKHNIEGYLFGDIRKLQVSDANADGVGYPLLMTVFSGIEFLGSLLSPNDKERAFGVYWRHHLYVSAPRNAFGVPLYKLVRNGIAHSFLMKGKLGVLQRSPDLHLALDANGHFIIDAAALGDDFLESYDRAIRPILAGPSDDARKVAMQGRLDLLEKHDQLTSDRYWRDLTNAPRRTHSTFITTSASIALSNAGVP